MATFRGVDQKEVASSIREAGQFLVSLNVGSAFTAEAKLLLNETSLAAIENAATPDELHQAVCDSGVLDLSRHYDLLEMHAALNTHGKGYNVLLNLLRWGPFVGYTLEKRSSDVEELLHIKNKMRNPLNALRRLAFEFQGAAKLQKIDPFQEYGLVIEAEQELRMSKARTLLPAFEKVLRPHEDAGNSKMIFIGDIGDRDTKGVRKHGLGFVATADVARDVAAKFPDHKVIDSKNRPVEPKL